MRVFKIHIPLFVVEAEDLLELEQKLKDINIRDKLRVLSDHKVKN